MLFPYIIKSKQLPKMFWKDYQQTKHSQTPSLEQNCSLFGQQQRTTHQGIPEANPFFRQKHSNYGCFIERDQILMNLFFFMNLNSLQLQNLEENLGRNGEHLKAINSYLYDIQDKQVVHDAYPLKEQKFQMTHLDSPHEESRSIYSGQPLIDHIFGRRSYRYRLQLEGAAPHLLFKERNFNLNVILVDHKGDRILNSNIINLCLGICNQKGEWVTKNKIKQDILKGKSETELYHGQASWVKLYLREVSRRHPEGKLNIVIYPKPSMLRFVSNCSRWQKILESEEIEPLILKDISVVSKTKNS